METKRPVSKEAMDWATERIAAGDLDGPIVLNPDGTPKTLRQVVVRSNSDVGVAEFTNGRWVISPTVWEGGDETGGLADLPFTPTHWILKTELLNL